MGQQHNECYHLFHVRLIKFMPASQLFRRQTFLSMIPFMMMMMTPPPLRLSDGGISFECARGGVCLYFCHRPIGNMHSYQHHQASTIISCRDFTYWQRRRNHMRFMTISFVLAPLLNPLFLLLSHILQRSIVFASHTFFHNIYI